MKGKVSGPLTPGSHSVDRVPVCRSIPSWKEETSREPTLRHPRGSIGWENRHRGTTGPVYEGIRQEGTSTDDRNFPGTKKGDLMYSSPIIITDFGWSPKIRTGPFSLTTVCFTSLNFRGDRVNHLRSISKLDTKMVLG